VFIFLVERAKLNVFYELAERFEWVCIEGGGIAARIFDDLRATYLHGATKAFRT